MSCKQRCPTVVLFLLILCNISTIALAFQNVQRHHVNNNNFGSLSGGGTSTHQHQNQLGTSSPVVAAAKRSSSDGYDDWYIDEEENDEKSEEIIDSVSTNGAPSTNIDNPSNQIIDNKNNDDRRIRTYFATCIPGLHETLSYELISLGATNIEPQGKSGVKFMGTSIVGMKVILWCRTAHKVMELIASSSSSSSSSFQQLDDYDNEYNDDYYTENSIRNKDDLYHFIKSSIHTPTLLGNGYGGLLTLSVSTIYASKPPNKDLCHGHFTALTVKNALVDSVRELRDDGDRPNVDVEDSGVPLVVVIKGRQVDGGGGGRKKRNYGDGRRGNRGSNSYNNEYNNEQQDENMVADVDLYRVLHSGGSLHRRGYRQGNAEDDGWDDDKETKYDSSNSAPIHRAAMKESLAAGLLLEAGWDKLVMAARGDGQGAVLVDPMAGSATFPVEAALIACDMAPGLLRIASWRGGGKNGSSSSSSQNRNPHRYPPCVRWKDFGTSQDWDEFLTSAAQRAKSGMKWARSVQPESGLKNVKILCNELNPRAASLARSSIRSAGVGALVSLSQGDCVDWDLGGDNDGEEDDTESTSRDVIEGRTIFVSNPPWGLRLTEDIDESWVSLREFLRREAGGCESWVLSGNKDLTKILRMKKSRTVVVKTADEDLRWLQYHIFQKSKVST